MYLWLIALDPGALDGIQGTVKYPAAFDAIVGMGIHKSYKELIQPPDPSLLLTSFQKRVFTRIVFRNKI